MAAGFPIGHGSINRVPRTKNLQLRGRIWWVKKMVAGVLVHRSLETTDREEAIRRMPAMMASALPMRRRISQQALQGQSALPGGPGQGAKG